MYAVRSSLRIAAARPLMARTLATAAPVQLFGLDGSYATALVSPGSSQLQRRIE